MNIYHTHLKSKNTDLENQLMLEAQAKYALATDHTHLMDGDDILFEIYVEDNDIVLDQWDTSSPEEEESDEADGYVTNMSNEEIIDLIIHNSLLSPNPITEQQARTMLILAQLKNTIKGI